MDFRSALIDIALVRTDGETQVRETLDQEYVTELLALWEDNRNRDLPPVVIYRDEDGSHWLADGFHRHAAAMRAESDSILAEVRHGSLDMARIYAAGANTRNGMRLSQGDKKRAILLADKSARASGKPMGVRELARLVGCSPEHVSNTLGGGVNSGQCSSCLDESPVHLRIKAELKADQFATDPEIAERVGCDKQVVGRVRSSLGEPARGKGLRTQAKIAEALERGLSNNGEIARALGLTREGVRKARELLVSKPDSRILPPSAPINPKREDPRGKAEVIQMRKPVERPDQWLADMMSAWQRGNAQQRAAFLDAIKAEELAG